jgi:hypothetical protein
MPGAAPWGAPPPPKKRKGLIIGIVAGVLALAVIGIGVAYFVGKKVTSFPEAKYRLTLEQKVLDGKYELAQDLSATQGQKMADEADGAWDAKDAKAVVGQYAMGGDQTKGVLVISGMYGRFKNVDEARDNMMKGAGDADGATVVVEPRDFHPAGSDVTITCQVVTQSSGGVDITMPMCGWADGNTGASIAKAGAGPANQDPKSVDLDAAAAETAKIRQEIRQPL